MRWGKDGIGLGAYAFAVFDAAKLEVPDYLQHDLLEAVVCRGGLHALCGHREKKGNGRG